MRVSDLAATVHNDLSTVSRQVSNLQDHGLINKVSNPEDRRVQLLTLTDQGRSLVEATRQARAKVFDELLSDWDPADVESFTHYLRVFADDMHTRHLAHNEGAPL